MQNKKLLKLLHVQICLIILFLIGSCSPRITPNTNHGTEVRAEQGEKPEPAVNENNILISVNDENKVIDVLDSETNTDSVSAQLERVNELYEEGVKQWDEGDSDAALASFDQAYTAMAQISVDVDSPRAEEKNQLRLMIAKGIQGIYASFATIGESSQSIALDENQHVLAEIRRFQTVERQYFLESFARSGLYRGMMAKKMRDAGLPEELSWLPLIESGFKIRAYSSARALGLWQFISSTGNRYGLKKDRWIDERMDPEKATDAAVLYFKELHTHFGDWTTALAAYNCGEFRIQRLIRSQKTNYFDNFWDLYLMLPRETARFVPRFIATLLIVKDPQKYQMELPQLMTAMSTERIRSEFPFKLEQLSVALSLHSDTLADLNPELRHKSTPDHPYELKVPTGCETNAMMTMASLSKWIPSEVETTVHRVRKGDTVSDLARKYRTSIDAILRLNNLKKRHTLRIGQGLRIPGRWTSSAIVSPTFVNLQKESEPLAQPNGTEPYTVKPGDTLFAIARQYQMSVDQLKILNRIGSNARIFPGQRLWVVSAGSNG